MDRLKITAFRAWDDPQRAKTFAFEHAQVLRDVGVIDALPQDTSWCDDESCIVVVAEHPELGMVGGCRIQLAKEGIPLPFVRSLAPLVPNLHEQAVQLLGKGSSELCGLWVASRFTGHGVPWLVTSAAVAVLNQIEVGTVLCLAAEYSAQYAMRNGFQIQPQVGSQGSVAFPIPSIRSYALALTDPFYLSAASTSERQRIISLRIKPSQHRTEWLKGSAFDVYYDIQLRQRVIKLTPPGPDQEAAARRSA
jgi:hypothetical protein